VAQGAPTLAVEVARSRNTTTQTARKALEYLVAGAQMAWVVDPGAQSVMVFTPPNQIRIVGADETLEGEGALPGFSCSVSGFFE